MTAANGYLRSASDPALVRADAPSYPLHELAHLDVEERARRTLRIGDTRFPGIERDNPKRFEKMLAYMIAADAIGADNPDRAKGRALQLEARRRHDTYDRLPQLSIPVYTCGGRYDGIAPPANLEALHTQIANSQLEFFEGGHLFMIQDRTAFEHHRVPAEHIDQSRSLPLRGEGRG